VQFKSIYGHASVHDWCSSFLKAMKKRLLSEHRLKYRGELSQMKNVCVRELVLKTQIAVNDTASTLCCSVEMQRQLFMKTYCA
jgi:hypothetical protein